MGRKRISSLIKTHINNLARTELFTNRDFLQYGSKRSIHQATYRLVDEGFIQRVALGVFAKPDVSVEDGEITAFDVARAKARAFGRWCACSLHGARVNVKEEVLPDGRKQVTVPIHGYTTAFMFGDTRIVLSGKGKVHEQTPLLADYPPVPEDQDDDDDDDDEPDPEYLQWMREMREEREERACPIRS